MLRFIKCYLPVSILVFLGVVGATHSAWAQDPGFADSVVLECDSVVNYNPGIENYVDIYLYCITDDSILFVNVPLKWSGDPWYIYPLETYWENTFGLWDCQAYYPGLGSNHLLLCAGVEFGHSGPPLFTYFQRELEVRIRFAISPFALPQVVTVDTTVDAIGGKIEMANIDITFRPKFRGAHFRYGVPGQGVESVTGYPGAIALKEPYPNPFNSSAMIEFELAEVTHCRLIIYDILGREIAYLVDGELQIGRYSMVWDGKDNSGKVKGTGVYFVRLITDRKTETQRITLIR